jgi:hypothetical protein
VTCFKASPRSRLFGASDLSALATSDAPPQKLKKEHHSPSSLKSMPPRRGISGYCGATQIRVDKWRAVVNLPGRKVHLGPHYGSSFLNFATCLVQIGNISKQNW